MFHSVLEEHYKAIRLVQTDKLERKELPHFTQAKILPLLWNDDGTQNDMQELVMWLYGGYCDMYGDDIDEWNILNTEHEAVVALPTGLPKNGKKARKSQFHLKMRIDMVARRIRDGKLYIWDHKTCSQLPNEKELAIDDQLGLYTWGMRELGRKVYGSIYNAVRKQRNKTEPQTLESRHSRSLQYRLDTELDMIAFEAYLAMKRAYAIPSGMADRAPNTDMCRWKCGYLSACLVGRKEGNERTREFLKDIGFKQDFTRH